MEVMVTEYKNIEKQTTALAIRTRADNSTRSRH